MEDVYWGGGGAGSVAFAATSAHTHPPHRGPVVHSSLVLVAIACVHVLVNSRALIRRRSMYVQQEDVFYPHLTVREHLNFQAALRLPNTLPKEVKDGKG